MNHSDFVRHVADVSGVAPGVVDTVLRSAARSSAHLLRGGQSVPILRVGRLVVVNRAARKARNPRTGASVSVPARRAVRFKASVNLDVE